MSLAPPRGEAAPASALLLAFQPLRWRYLWLDPPSGAQNVRVRAVSALESRIAETSVSVAVDPTAASGIRDPYSRPGGFYKGHRLAI